VRKLAYTLHALTGATAGLLLAIVCLTGSIAAIAPDLDAIAAPPSTDDPVSWEAARRAAEARTGSGRLRSIALVQGRLESRIRTGEGVLRRAHHDRATGAVITTEPFLDARWTVRELHRRLLAGRVGHYVVCSSALFLIVSVLTGLLFERRAWRWLRRRGESERARLKGWHVRLGLLSLPFAAVFGLTGSWYLVEAVIEDTGGRIGPAIPWRAAQRPADFDPLVARARAAMPGLRPTGVSVDGGVVWVEGRRDAALARDRAHLVVLDAADGEVLLARAPEDMGAVERWSHAADPLHFGTLGGRATRWLWALGGLLLTGLCLSGAWIHARRVGASPARATSLVEVAT